MPSYENGKRKKAVMVELTDEQMIQFKKRSKERGLTTAAWLRMLGLEDIVRKGF